MALTFITAIESVSADLVTAQLVDLTTYGGANPDRNELALYVYLFKRDALNNDTQIAIDNTNPLLATSWSFSLATADGVYVAIVYGFLIWSAGTYPLGTQRYHAGSYYKANTSTSSTPGADGTWDLITDIQAESTGNSTVEQTQTYNFSVARSSAGPLGDALADLGPKIKDGKCKNWNEAGSVLIGGALIESAWVNFRRADYVNAQEIMDYVQSVYAAAA